MLWIVQWRDAFFDFDQPDDDDGRDEYLVTTVGFFVKETKRFLSIAQEQLPGSDGFRAVTRIPIPCIIERHELHIGVEEVSVPADFTQEY